MITSAHNALPEWGQEQPSSAVDWPFFYRATMGNKTLAAEVVCLFYTQVSDYVAQLAAMNNDVGHPDCAFVAHAMRSAAGAIGARTLLQQARALEMGLLPSTTPVIVAFSETLTALGMFFEVKRL